MGEMLAEGGVEQEDKSEGERVRDSIMLSRLGGVG